MSGFLGMIYTIGGSFWEFGGPDLERAKLFVMIGTAEDHHSNPMKMELSKFKRQGGKFISINPVRTGYSAITNAWRGDPYPIDTLFLFMANMAWNSSMNTSEVRKMLNDKNEDGEYKIPFLIVAGAFQSETVAFADLVLPDTSYLERHAHIEQKAQGAMAGSFNTREYFHGASERKYKNIKWAFLVLVFPVPLILVSIGLGAHMVSLLAAAFLVQYIGLLMERWFFFAQANHPQNLYYQTV